jgi:poly-gamma-glutamate capsule biosynthesis protein CapA/YwtB (metallophosphatase superfamily)
MSTIIIGGDVCPIGKVENAFKKGEEEKILNDLLPVFKDADFRVINLECPLIVKESPIEKDGPVLGANIEAAHGLKAIGIDAVNLANNHILDHGEEGLKSTIESCKKHMIDFFGAAKNLEEAQKPLIKIVGGKRFCFMGVAEHEFSIAKDNNWGANPLDPIKIVRTLKTFRSSFDFLIVLVHGGKEYYRNPTPKQQDFCKFLVEEGADAVICQHSHCAGTYEYYKDKPIVYGQGNFIFENLGRNIKMWNEGFLVSLAFNEEKITANFIPFTQSAGHVGVSLMKGKEKKIFLKNLEERSKKITSVEYVKEQWLELCKKEKYLYASRVLGHNRVLRVLNRKLHFSDWLYSKTTKMMVRNVVECEVHREGLKTLWELKK